MEFWENITQGYEFVQLICKIYLLQLEKFQSNFQQQVILSICNCNWPSSQTVTFFSTNKKSFNMAALRTQKIIWYMRQWQANSTTSVPAIFCTRIPLSANLSWQWNSVMPTSSLLNLGLKPSSSISEKHCWCRNCCQWSAALLRTHLSSSKTMHRRIALTT